MVDVEAPSGTSQSMIGSNRAQTGRGKTEYAADNLRYEKARASLKAAPALLILLKSLLEGYSIE